MNSRKKFAVIILSPIVVLACQRRPVVSEPDLTTAPATDQSDTSLSTSSNTTFDPSTGLGSVPSVGAPVVVDEAPRDTLGTTEPVTPADTSETTDVGRSDRDSTFQSTVPALESKVVTKMAVKKKIRRGTTSVKRPARSLDLLMRTLRLQVPSQIEIQPETQPKTPSEILTMISSMTRPRPIKSPGVIPSTVTQSSEVLMTWFRSWFLSRSLSRSLSRLLAKVPINIWIGVTNELVRCSLIESRSLTILDITRPNI